MRSVTGAEEDVARLFDPASVAVIGASTTPAALSPAAELHLLRNNGFRGAIYPVATRIANRSTVCAATRRWPPFRRCPSWP